MDAEGPRTESPTLALVRRVEAAEAEGLATSARTLSGRGLARVRAVAGGWAVFAGAGLPINRAVGLGMSGPVTAADVDELEQVYADVGAVGQVDVCPYAHESLPALLRTRGYTLLRFFSVLARPISPSDAAERREGPLASDAPPVHVERVPPERADAWAETAARGFSERDDLRADDVNLILSRIAAHRSDVGCYLATIDGAPAGVGALSMHDGLATLFSASTLPPQRRRGVQAALLRARVHDAAAAGCDVAVVMSRPGSDSERNIERAGWRTVYSRAVTVRRP